MSVKELVALGWRWIPAALSSLMCRKDGQLPCCLPFFHGQQNPPSLPRDDDDDSPFFSASCSCSCWLPSSCLLIFLYLPRRALRKRSRRWEGSLFSSFSCISDVDQSGLMVIVTNSLIVSSTGKLVPSKINLRTPKGSWFSSRNKSSPTKPIWWYLKNLKKNMKNLKKDMEEHLNSFCDTLLYNEWKHK